MRLIVRVSLVLAAMTPIVPAQSERPTFPLQYVDAVPANLSGVHTADVDGDGDLDILTASLGRLEVQLGDGHGYFPDTQETPIAASTFGITVGDVDGDGIPDVAVSSGTDNGVRILLGTGSGGFVHGALVPAGTNPREPVLADLDGDGDLDLAVARTTVGQLAVAMGNGSGGFGPVSNYATAGSFATELAAADLDGDQDIDLVVAFEVTMGLQVFRNDGRGSLAGDAFLVAPTSTDVLAADLTGDGLIDLVATGVSVFAGQAGGGFAAAQPWGPPLPSGGIARSLAAADLDGDGDIDLVVGPAKVGIKETYVLVNEGGSSATLLAVKTASNHGPVALADLNGDGLIDRLSAPASATGGVWVALNGLDPLFEAASELSLPSLPFRGITSGDVDGDGAPEVVAVCSALDGFTQLVAVATPSLAVVAQTLVNLAGAAPNRLWAGDLDGDGYADAALHDVSADSVLVVHGQAGGGFGAHQIVPAAIDPTFVTGGDLDADGDLDLVTVQNFGSSIALLWNDGQGGFSAPQLLAVPLKPTLAFMGDLDGDAWPDLVVTHNPGSNLSLLFGSGDHGFEPVVPLAIDSGPDDLVIADLDLDGDSDLAVIDSGGLRLLKGVGAGAFVLAFVTPSGSTSRLDCGDVDGDGLPDLVTDGSLGAVTVVYPGADVFAPKAEFACEDDSQRSLLIDADADGLLDLVLCDQVLEVHWNVSDQHGPLAKLGSGLAGSNGTPHWSGLGTLQSQTPLALTLAHAKPGAPLTLVLGTSVLEAPFKGGTMVPQPQLLIAGLAANATGALALSTTWPGGIPSGFLLATQCWIVDPAGPAGLSASNGLLLTAP